MGPYSSFDDCVRHNKDKRDPKAYCGKIYWATEGRRKKKMLGKDRSGSFSGAGGSVSVSESGDEIRVRTRVRKNLFEIVNEINSAKKALSGPVATYGSSAPEEEIPGARSDQPFAVAHGPDNYHSLTSKAVDMIYRRVISRIDKSVLGLDTSSDDPLVDALCHLIDAVHGREHKDARYIPICELLCSALEALCQMSEPETTKVVLVS